MHVVIIESSRKINWVRCSGSMTFDCFFPQVVRCTVKVRNLGTFRDIDKRLDLP
jgi:hypothetical protein